MYLCLHFLPLLQVEAILVGLLVAVELLQLLCQCGSTFTGLLLQTMVLLDLDTKTREKSDHAKASIL